ncbi:FtsB family cell division protein [Moorella sulfitireducens]|uniref:FtsB family cell division protein n=1 Tax=Neomoorella sulfitireducens TaxID=2972948 RepID=UPI0021AC739D|nr:septum formation initiator family protein [Moorella sulfitireducens]
MGKIVRFPHKRSYWPILLAGITSIYFFYCFMRTGLALYQTNLQIRAYQEQKAGLIAENNRLQEQIKELNNDNYIERIAREELGLIKPGESVIIQAVPGQVRPYIPPASGNEFRD